MSKTARAMASLNLGEDPNGAEAVGRAAEALGALAASEPTSEVRFVHYATAEDLAFVRGSSGADLSLTDGKRWGIYEAEVG